jgi:hypothetical protein
VLPDATSELWKTETLDFYNLIVDFRDISPCGEYKGFGEETLLLICRWVSKLQLAQSDLLFGITRSNCFANFFKKIKILLKFA